jgi:hypothetical protein
MLMDLPVAVTMRNTGSMPVLIMYASRALSWSEVLLDLFSEDLVSNRSGDSNMPIEHSFSMRIRMPNDLVEVSLKAL